MRTPPSLSSSLLHRMKDFATCSEDRAFRLWHVSSFADKNHTYIETKINLDHISHFAFSTDGKAAAGVLARDRKIRLFKVSHKHGFTAVTDIGDSSILPAGTHVAALDMVANHMHKYILVCFDNTSLLVSSCCVCVSECVCACVCMCVCVCLCVCVCVCVCLCVCVCVRVCVYVCVCVRTMYLRLLHLWCVQGK